MAGNPLLTRSDLPNYAPTFDKIKEEHFLPAIEIAIEEAQENIEAIKACNDEPDFNNTIAALEVASETLGTASSIFYNQLSAAGTDELRNLAEQIVPINAAFSSDVMMDDDLFSRVKSVMTARTG